MKAIEVRLPKKVNDGALPQLLSQSEGRQGRNELQPFTVPERRLAVMSRVTLFDAKRKRMG